MKLQFLQHTDLSNIIDTLISLSAAFILEIGRAHV